MSKQLNETVGTMVFGNIINGTYPPAEVWHVDYAEGGGVIKRGTVLSINSSGEAIKLGSDYILPYANDSVTVTSHAASVTQTGLDTSALVVKDGATGLTMALTTDYTFTYDSTSGALAIALVSGSDYYSASEIKITCDKVQSYAKANCICAEEVDTGTTGSGTVTGIAYKTGCFNRNNLIYADTYTFTSDDEESLRALGIFMNDSMEY